MVYNCTNNRRFSLFPPICLLCSSTDTNEMDICNPCMDDLSHNINCCRICALPLSQHSPDSPICGNCLRQPPPFDNCHAIFAYSYPISNLISGFKFSGKLENGRLLAQLLIRSIEANRLPLPELILPVPLHRSRLRERGFNQALELALPLGRHFGIPVDIHRCKRTRATEAQSNLHKRERQKNIRGAFSLKHKLEHSHVAILDDVVTTGSTITELARTLKSSGVSQVDIWALARTIPHC